MIFIPVFIFSVLLDFVRISKMFQVFLFLTCSYVLLSFLIQGTTQVRHEQGGYRGSHLKS